MTKDMANLYNHFFFFFYKTKRKLEYNDFYPIFVCFLV